jgi:hypothetical protein
MTPPRDCRAECVFVWSWYFVQHRCLKSYRSTRYLGTAWGNRQQDQVSSHLTPLSRIRRSECILHCLFLVSKLSRPSDKKYIHLHTLSESKVTLRCHCLKPVLTTESLMHISGSEASTTPHVSWLRTSIFLHARNFMIQTQRNTSCFPECLAPSTNSTFSKTDSTHAKMFAFSRTSIRLVPSLGRTCRFNLANFFHSVCN